MDETAADALRESLGNLSSFAEWLVEYADAANIMLVEGVTADDIKPNTPIVDVFHDSQSVMEAVFAFEEALDISFEYNANEDAEATMIDFFNRLKEPEAVG